MADNSSQEYTAQQIKVLPGIEGVRMRPAMYIGDTSTRGLHHLVEEVIANSVDEAMAGVCKNIDITINADGSITVRDDGRGIPVDEHETEKKPAVEVIMTTLHSGAKFDRATYKVAGGLHGVGVSVVNALSEWLVVEVSRNNAIYRQRYERGKSVTSLDVVGVSHKTGTVVSFKPDAQIFETLVFSYETIAARCRELAFLNPGLTLRISDERTGKSETFMYEGGLKAFVAHLNEGSKPIHPDIIYVRRSADAMEVEVSLQYNDSYSETVYCYANNIATPDGGTHLSGFRAALTRTINNYGRKEGLLKEDASLEGDDVREGLTAVVSVKLPEPQFEGQTKAKLGNRDAQYVVDSCFSEELALYFEEHPQTARVIIQKAVDAAKAREAARKAREITRRKTALNSGDLPVKLHDCSTTDRERSELFIVEGKGAGGNAKQCRDASFQAVLPLQGKILNVEKARIDKMLSYAELQTLIAALGTGIGAEEFDLAKLRYGKIIIMTDADVDGLHIRTLLLTFFFRHMPKLIETGKLYIAQPPLYRVRRKQKEQYYLDERDYRRDLISWGLDGTRFSAGPSRDLSGKELRELVDILSSLEEHESILRRHGTSLEELIEKRLPSGDLPRFRVLVDTEKRLLYTQQEVDELLRSLESEEAAAATPTPEGQPPADQAPIGHDVSVVQLRETEEISRLLRRLRELGFEPSAVSSLEEPLVVTSDGTRMEVDRLIDLPSVIRRIAETGLDVQRYKGLGEMNPDQLGETTVNPRTRQLLRVRCEDAIEASRIFNLLMGSDVLPRREFIQRHALEATNLDV